MKIAIVGGGPGGLFLARLIRRHDPSIVIDIFEQNPPEATFGFGVVLAGQAQDRLMAADPELMNRLARSMVVIREQNITLESEVTNVRMTGGGGAIERLTMLRILEDLCREVGLEVRHDHRVETREDLSGYDMVVGADGANSVVRRLWSEGFKPRSRLLGNRFAWYGVDKALHPSSLVFRRLPSGGTLIAHFYPYTDNRSTFVAECDARAWTGGGLCGMIPEDRKALFEKVFAAELSGGRLLENKSDWRQFEALTADSWHTCNVTLIGDALRIAHFSIGSGTRLAMEDAVALFEAIKTHGRAVPEVLEAYVTHRRAVRDTFTAATVASFNWYEDIATAMQSEPIDFVYRFMTRTGRMDDARLKSFAPDFFARYQAWREGCGAP